MSYVIPDLKPFKSNDGAQIEGRRQWKEHLKNNNLVEYGHSDISKAAELHAKRQREAAEKAEKLAKDAFMKTDWDAVKDLPHEDRKKSRVWCKVAERIEGREKPSRKQLLSIVIEEVKRNKRSI